MPMTSRTLSPILLEQLARGLEEQGAYDWVSTRLFNLIPPDRIKARSGKMPYIPAASMIGSGAVDTAVALGADAVELEFNISERPYDLQRYAGYQPVNAHLIQHDAVYQQAEKELFPSVAHQIGLGVDKTAELIFQGKGLAADSQDVTVTQVPAGARWDTTDGDPLGMLEEAIDKIGGPNGVVIFLSPDRAKLLQNNAEVRASVLGNTAVGRVGRKALADHLADHLGVEEVVIGTRIFQDGATSDPFNAGYVFNKCVFVTKKANLARIVEKGMEVPKFEIEHYPKKETAEYIGNFHTMLGLYAPEQSIAIVDAVTGEVEFD